MNQILENSLIAGILTIFIIVPVCLVIVRSRKRRKQKISRELKAAERKMGLSFDHVDQLGFIVIALGPWKKKIIQIDRLEYQIGQIDLADVDSCALMEVKRGGTLQLLQLVLMHRKAQYRLLPAASWITSKIGSPNHWKLAFLTRHHFWDISGCLKMLYARQILETYTADRRK
ncbi:MAG: hypothetical protein ACTHMI_14395 [Mucilaginibacter sp.]